MIRRRNDLPCGEYLKEPRWRQKASLNFFVSFCVFRDNTFVKHVREDTAERGPCGAQLLGDISDGGDAAVGFEVFDDAITKAVDGVGATLILMVCA